MNRPVIKAAQLRKTYRSGDVETEVLRGIDLSLEEGGLYAIVGASGSGKSTLLHILGMLDAQTGGTLEILGEDTTSLPDRRKAILRRRSIGFVFQSFYLIPGLTVYENVMMPNLLDRRKPDPAALEALLDRVGLSHRKHHRPLQLSGGEQQRAAIARALANRPPILLADEPTGNLDSKSAAQVLGLLRDINRENGVTLVLVTHSSELARSCDEILQVKDGVLV